MVFQTMTPNALLAPLPVIHSGGTHRDCLHEDYLRAHHALYEAIHAFDQIEFNQRDYHLNGSWNDALAHRTHARTQLLKVLTYLEMLLDNAVKPKN